jgi:hypothetical protein
VTTPATPADQPLSVRSFLVGDDADRFAVAALAVSELGIGRIAVRAVREVTESARAALGAEVMRTVDALLDLDLGGLVVAGWKKHAALAAAAERTRTAPGTSAVVSLAEHTVSSAHKPHVDLLVREKRVARVHVELSVEVTVRGLAATVRDGRLVSLTGGAGEISARLAVEDRELAHRKARADLPLVVRLGDGVPLGRARKPQLHVGDSVPPAAPTGTQLDR